MDEKDGFSDPKQSAVIITAGKSLSGESDSLMASCTWISSDLPNDFIVMTALSS